MYGEYKSDADTRKDRAGAAIVFALICILLVAIAITGASFLSDLAVAWALQGVK